jgi:hypothetical protein
VKPSTFEPDIDMIDLTAQDDSDPIPESSLKEDRPVANVQSALHEKKTPKGEVEISLPHHLPTKDRHNRPSVSFALPVESQRYPWPETSTFARKQRTYLGVFKTRTKLGYIITLTIKISQLRNTIKYTKPGKNRIITRPRLGLYINRDIPRQRRKNTRNLKNQLKGLPRFTFSSIYILCLLTLLLLHRLSNK